MLRFVILMVTAMYCDPVSTYAGVCPHGVQQQEVNILSREVLSQPVNIDENRAVEK